MVDLGSEVGRQAFKLLLRNIVKRISKLLPYGLTASLGLHVRLFPVPCAVTVVGLHVRMQLSQRFAMREGISLPVLRESDCSKPFCSGVRS